MICERKLSDNEMSYLMFQDVSTPVIQFILQSNRIDTKLLNTYLNMMPKIIKELNLSISNGRFIHKNIKLFAKEVLNNDFDGYNFEKLDILFKPIQNGLIEVYNLISHDKSFILFRVSHSFMDGQGVLVFLRILFDTIRGVNDFKITNCFESDIEFTKKLNTKNTPRDLLFNNRLLIRSKCKESKIYAKRLTVKANIQFVLSKIVRILNKFYTNDKLTYLIPTSIRRYDRSKVTLSNLTLPLYLRCYKSDNEFEITKKIYSQLKNKDDLNIKNIRYGPLVHIRPKRFFYVMRLVQIFQKLTNRYLTCGNVTNLGKLDLTLYSSDNIKIETIFNIPVYQPMIPLSISIVETQKFTEIVFVSNANVIDKNTANKILYDIYCKLEGK